MFYSISLHKLFGLKIKHVLSTIKTTNQSILVSLETRKAYQEPKPT